MIIQVSASTGQVRLVMTLQLRVYVPPHPLIKHWLAVARDRATPLSYFAVR